jgi:hypothetical protein
LTSPDIKLALWQPEQVLEMMGLTLASKPAASTTTFGVSGVAAAIATLEMSSAAKANLGALPLRFDTIRFLQMIGMAHFSGWYLE